MFIIGRFSDSKRRSCSFLFCFLLHCSQSEMHVKQRQCLILLKQSSCNESDPFSCLPHSGSHFHDWSYAWSLVSWPYQHQNLRRDACALVSWSDRQLAWFQLYQYSSCNPSILCYRNLPACNAALYHRSIDTWYHIRKWVTLILISNIHVIMSNLIVLLNGAQHE